MRRSIEDFDAVDIRRCKSTKLDGAGVGGIVWSINCGSALHADR